MTTVIGIVGGMASGKSTVVNIISNMSDAYIISADEVGHEILKKGNPAYNPVINKFGSGILNEDGEIERSRLGKIVFSNPSKLEELNKISHPLIYKSIKSQIDSLKRDNKFEYIVIDAALLIEIKLIELVDQVWAIYAPLNTRIKRIMLRNGLSEEDANKRISAQLSWNEIKKHSDIVINNSKSVNHIKKQVAGLLNI